jgi:hypothetical protein
LTESLSAECEVEYAKYKENVVLEDIRKKEEEQRAAERKTREEEEDRLAEIERLEHEATEEAQAAADLREKRRQAGIKGWETQYRNGRAKGNPKARVSAPAIRRIQEEDRAMTPVRTTGTLEFRSDSERAEAQHDRLRQLGFGKVGHAVRQNARAGPSRSSARSDAGSHGDYNCERRSAPLRSRSKSKRPRPEMDNDTSWTLRQLMREYRESLDEPTAESLKIDTRPPKRSRTSIDDMGRIVFTTPAPGGYDTPPAPSPRLQLKPVTKPQRANSSHAPIGLTQCRRSDSKDIGDKRHDHQVRNDTHPYTKTLAEIPVPSRTKIPPLNDAAHRGSNLSAQVRPPKHVMRRTDESSDYGIPTPKIKRGRDVKQDRNGRGESSRYSPQTMRQVEYDYCKSSNPPRGFHPPDRVQPNSIRRESLDQDPERERRERTRVEKKESDRADQRLRKESERREQREREEWEQQKRDRLDAEEEEALGPMEEQHRAFWERNREREKQKAKMEKREERRRERRVGGEGIDNAISVDEGGRASGGKRRDRERREDRKERSHGGGVRLGGGGRYE